MPHGGADHAKDVTKISHCRINTTSRWGIKQLGSSFGSIFLLFSNKSSRGGTLLVAGENPRSPALNDNPAMLILSYYHLIQKSNLTFIVYFIYV